MADLENMRTASLYINNQLLSRGLLRDGQKIDFADPGNSQAGADATMGMIMSIVNDLILRRDRDAENRESLSATLRNLRAENLRHTDDIARLTEKHKDAKRKLDIAESSETAIKAQLKSAEAAVRGLKEEMARAKTLVTQTRASCATEVRRRDRQIDGLKKQLGDAGRARGSARNPAVTVINVLADVGEEKATPSKAANVSGGDYSLRGETNQFLTQLARDLSEENEALLAMARRTLSKLKEMSGWDKGQSRGNGDVTTLQTNCDEIEAEMESLLEHLRTILTNPSFVPIEEVEMRDEEINHLKGGWVKMESRWQEAVHLIDGWRKRMANNGKGVNLEELNQGLRLSPVRVRDVAETRHGMNIELSRVEEEEETEDATDAMRSPCPAPRLEESLHLEPAPDYEVEVDEADSDAESSIFEDEVDMDELEASEPNIEILHQSTAFLSSSPLPAPPELSPLKDSASAGNRRAQPENHTKRPRPGDCSTIAEESAAWDLSDESEPPRPPPHRINLPRSPQKAMRLPSPEVDEQQRVVSVATDCSLDDVLLIQEPTDPPSPSPLPKDRTRALRGPSKPDIQQKMSDTKHTTANDQKEGLPSQPRIPTRSREVSSQSVEDGIAPQPALVHQTPISHRNRSPNHTSSRLPLPRPSNPPPQQSPLTMANIAAKLAASEREADAARVRAKLKAARGGGGARRLNSIPSSTVDANENAGSFSSEVTASQPALPEATGEEDVDPVKRSVPAPGQGGTRPPEAGYARDEQQVLPKRRREKRVSKAASRRRSTLSPWEMQSLITGSVAVASPARPGA